MSYRENVKIKKSLSSKEQIRKAFLILKKVTETSPWAKIKVLRKTVAVKESDPPIFRVEVHIDDIFCLSELKIKIQKEISSEFAKYNKNDTDARKNFAYQSSLLEISYVTDHAVTTTDSNLVIVAFDQLEFDESTLMEIAEG